MKGKRSVALDPIAGLPPGSSNNIPGPVRWLVWWMAALLMAVVVITPLDVHGQALFGGGLFVLTWLVGRLPGRNVSMFLIAVSVAVSSRYIYWRVTTTMGIEDPVDMTLGAILLTAEIYAYVVLLLGFVNSAWPLRRKPVALPADFTSWPTVDVMIPTYNEPLDVVRATIQAARQLDWPADKLRVHLLDDGRREEFREYAHKVGVNYIVRPDNKHAKAGNINHALKQTSGDYVAIFDCDHVPTRAFLQLSMGWMVRDPKLVLIQLPHHFYSPDPLERNLHTFRRVPNEGELFYGVLQRGNDLWDASFFCGSCAVIKRGPLEEIGGIAPETVTEDAHTMLKLHRRGYRSAYLNIPLASGLATESLSAHIGQRIRWARGLTQIFRIDNPIFGRGLSMSQRLCYTAAMLHFLYGLPRLIFLTAPLAYLIFEAHIFNASATMIIAYALPHLAHAIMTNSRLQGVHRHSFWGEVYESILGYYITIPTTLALISPKLGTFNVTAKGGTIQQSYFDLKMSMPVIALFLLNALGMGMGLWRLAQGNAQSDAIWINIVWSIYNLVVLCAAIAVAWEHRQRRRQPRVTVNAAAMAWLDSGHVTPCEIVDMTLQGARIRFVSDPGLTTDDTFDFAIRDGEEVAVTAEVVRHNGTTSHVKFGDLDREQEAAIVRAIFGRPHAWLGWREGRRKDHPLLALGAVTSSAIRGLGRLPRAFGSRPQGSMALIGAGLALASMLATPGPVRAQDMTSRSVSISLEDLGLDASLQQYSTQTGVELPFYTRGDEVLIAATVELEFDVIATHITINGMNVLVNGEKVGRADLSGAGSRSLSFDVDSRLLAERNLLQLRLDVAGGSCPTLIPEGTWKVLSGGSVSMRSAPLPLSNDLSNLPLPFYDEKADEQIAVHLVLMTPATPQTLQAAGLVASYFGLHAGERITFSTSLGQIPETSAVVLLTNKEMGAIPGLPEVQAPTLRVVPHPAFPTESNKKLLVIQGRDPADVDTMSRWLALHPDAQLEGPVLEVQAAPLPKPRVAYDAPRWVPTDEALDLLEIVGPEQATHQGPVGGTIPLRFRVAPDLFAWPEEYIQLDLAWGQDGPPGVPLPSLKVEFNGRFIAELPVPEDISDRVRQEATLRLPARDLAGFNTLNIHIVPPQEGHCPDLQRDAVVTTLLEGSALHVDGLPNFRQLPDVAAFVNDGFPFSRMADLRDTAFVIPDQPLAEEISTLLSVMAHMAAVTGHPPTGAAVVNASNFSAAMDRDHIFIGLPNNWRDEPPIVGVTSRRAVPAPSWWQRTSALLQGRPLTTEMDRASQALAAEGEKSFLIGFQSDFNPGRSVMMITASSAAEMPQVSDLRGFADATTPRADLMIMASDKRAIFQLGDAYGSGQLPALTALRWFAANNWILLVPLVLLAAVLVAWVARRRFRHVEYLRLRPPAEASE